MSQNKGTKGTGMDGYRPARGGRPPSRKDHEAGYQPPQNQTKPPTGTPPQKP